MTLPDLITKLEQATGPNRELDCDVHNALHGTNYVPSPASVTGFFRSGSDNGCPIIDRYTASIDAAVALVERLLPGWHWEVTTTGHKPGATVVGDIPMSSEGAYAATPALALLIAALLALSKEQQP